MPTNEPNRPTPEPSDPAKLVHHHRHVVGDVGQMAPNHRHVIRANADPSTTLGRRLLAALDAVLRHPGATLVLTVARWLFELFVS